MGGPRLLYNPDAFFEPARVARSFAIDDGEPLKRAHKLSGKLAGQASDFWTMHADYWRTRGNMERAQDCELEAAKAKKGIR